jgi:hypothetical protein
MFPAQRNIHAESVFTPDKIGGAGNLFLDRKKTA